MENNSLGDKTANNITSKIENTSQWKPKARDWEFWLQ